MLFGLGYMQCLESSQDEILFQCPETSILIQASDEKAFREHHRSLWKPGTRKLSIAEIGRSISNLRSRFDLANLESLSDFI